MEVNKDEALRCLQIARNKEASQDFNGALKFTKKSMALYPTKEAKDYLNYIEPKSKDAPSVKEEKKEVPKAQKMESTTSQRAYTKEQVEAVKVIKSNAGDFYKILKIEKTATENEIKKSYRKLALQFHPDKNSAPGADEAFKLVNKAFSVLSDEDKRAQYDRYGGDPEQRGGGSNSNGFGGGGFRYQEEMSPEEIFNMFFGGHGFGNAHTTFVGPDGRRYMRQNRQSHQHRQQSNFESSFNMVQLLPILLLVVFSILSTLFSPTTIKEPDYIFERTGRYTKAFHTNNKGITYYANPTELHNFKSKVANHRFNSFEREIESYYIRRVYQQCQFEKDRLYNEKNQANGWFGWNRDEQRLKELSKRKLPNCEEYHRLVGHY